MVIEDVVTGQAQPLVIKKLTLYPVLATHKQRRLKVTNAELEGAVEPQLSLCGLARQPLENNRRGGLDVDALPLERFVFRGRTWITRRAILVIYDGAVDFDDDWRPRAVHLRRPDIKPEWDFTRIRQGYRQSFQQSHELGVKS